MRTGRASGGLGVVARRRCVGKRRRRRVYGGRIGRGGRGLASRGSRGKTGRGAIVGTTALRRTDDECESALAGDVDSRSSSSSSSRSSSGRKLRGCGARRQTGRARAMGSSIAVAVMAINKSKIGADDIGLAGAKTVDGSGRWCATLPDFSGPFPLSENSCGRPGGSRFEGAVLQLAASLRRLVAPGAKRNAAREPMRRWPAAEKSSCSSGAASAGKKCTGCLWRFQLLIFFCEFEGGRLLAGERCLPAHQSDKTLGLIGPHSFLFLLNPTGLGLFLTSPGEAGREIASTLGIDPMSAPTRSNYAISCPAP